MIDNQPTKDFAEIWKSLNDPNKKEERRMLKRREIIKQERETDFCLTEKNED